MNQIAPMSEFLLREAVPHPSPEFRVPLLEAGSFVCKFILGDAGENAICCGAPTNGKSWCPYHRGIVFQFSKEGPGEGPTSGNESGRRNRLDNKSFPDV
jgi:hypothetical protein